jgi:sugar/nucleoside kinase (ribokinase family)
MIIVLGDIVVDIVSRLRTELVRGSDTAASVQVMPGGSGANVAVWLGRSRRMVTLIGRVGDDLFGTWLAHDLEREGVATHLIRDRTLGTGVVQVLVEPSGERSMIPDRGANGRWLVEDVPEALIAAADLVHVVGYVLLDELGRSGALRAMDIARAHGVPISLDPSSHSPLQRLGPDGFWELVGHVDVLLPNRRESAVLSGMQTPEAALESLVTHAGVVAIKLDCEGCLAGDGHQNWRVPAPDVTVLNATGAGDAFDAAFLDRWLEDSNVYQACVAGVSLGSHAATLPTTR